MTQIQLTAITGYTPINVYVADYYGNNVTYVGQITSPAGPNPAPPTISFVVPSFFDGAPTIMIILVDANACQVFKLVDCAPSGTIVVLRTQDFIPITTEAGVFLIP